MTTAQPMTFESQDQGEETARADLYGVLASLFSSPPSQEMLDNIAASDASGDAVLEMAWIDLVDACKDADQEAVREEYEHLFIGVGKPEVMLYGSYYLAGFLMEKPLAQLRTDLALLGIERAQAVVESEDHIGTLCEVMRYLIASDDIVHVNLATQRQFFGDHMQQWILRACDAIDAHPDAVFYRHLSHLAREFFEVEMLAFDMA
ncbi:MAG: TorA maturation chaperone TorD [Janthinobacterium sp.]|jgi:TorA maturation chaperone TorD